MNGSIFNAIKTNQVVNYSLLNRKEFRYHNFLTFMSSHRLEGTNTFDKFTLEILD